MSISVTDSKNFELHTEPCPQSHPKLSLNVANFSASVVKIQDPDLEFVEEIDAEFGE